MGKLKWIGVALAALALPWAGGIARAVPTCDTSWLGGDGLWSDAAKWSGGIPSDSDAARDQVCITANGTYTVTVKGNRSAAELTLGGGTGVQTLQIEDDNVQGGAELRLTNQGGMSAEGIRSNGVVNLVRTQASSYTSFQITGGTLVNDGTIHSTAGADYRSFGGNLINDGTVIAESSTLSNGAGSTWVNNGTIDIRAGGELSFNVNGGVNFTQTSQGTLRIGIKSGSSFGRLLHQTGGTLALDGQLSVVRKKTYKPGAGTSFGVVLKDSPGGSFTKVVDAIVDKARYFKPVYAPDRVTLLVSDATLAALPASGPPGTSVTLSGSGFPAGDSVTLKFKDVDGTKTSLGTVTTDANGAFSVSKTVPANADPGVGKLSAKSQVTAVTPKAAFTVT
jgi:hypothetical protein